MSKNAAVIDAPGKHGATLIFLHGLGDEGASWAPAWTPLQKVMPFLKIVCPNAPRSPVTLNGGMRMPSWHDVKTLQSIDAEDFKGLPESMEIVKTVIREEVKSGIPSNKIILGGFSQGAAMSMITGYQFEHALAGIIAFSGYLPFNGDFSKAITQANSKTPLFIGHGDADPVVNVKAGKRAHEVFQAAGVPVDFQLYKGMQHSSSPPEMRAAFQFITQHLQK